ARPGFHGRTGAIWPGLQLGGPAPHGINVARDRLGRSSRCPARYIAVGSVQRSGPSFAGLARNQALLLQQRTRALAGWSGVLPDIRCVRAVAGSATFSYAGHPRTRVRAKTWNVACSRLHDWLGGYPFEVAKPADVMRKLITDGF